MKEIKVLGTGCAKCTTLYDNVKSAVAELGIDAVVEKEQDIMKIMEYKVMSVPALVVDSNVLSTGKVLTIEEVKKLLCI
ncbi:MAG: thioredoxin family protein [Muribaculaceae bacterium]